MTPTMTRAALLALCIAAGCGGGKATPAPAVAAIPDLHPLAGIVGNPLIITPVQSLRVAPELGLVTRQPALLAGLDSAIADSVRDRVGNQGWVFFDKLVKSFAGNPTYAADPHMLAVNSLRSSALKIGDRLVEPLATQLRTMIALQDARLVLIPVELRLDRTATGSAKPTVRLVLIDPRSSVTRWIGEVPGTELPTPVSPFSATIASRIADLFAAK